MWWRLIHTKGVGGDVVSTSIFALVQHWTIPALCHSWAVRSCIEQLFFTKSWIKLFHRQKHYMNYKKLELQSSWNIKDVETEHNSNVQTKKSHRVAAFRLFECLLCWMVWIVKLIWTRKKMKSKMNLVNWDFVTKNDSHIEKFMRMTFTYIENMKNVEINHFWIEYNEQILF